MAEKTIRAKLKEHLHTTAGNFEPGHVFEGDDAKRLLERGLAEVIEERETAPQTKGRKLETR